MERVMWVCVSKWGRMCRGNGLWEELGYMCTSGNRDCQLASRSVSNGFTEDALTISAGSLFQNGTAESVLATAGTASLLVENTFVVA